MALSFAAASGAAGKARFRVVVTGTLTEAWTASSAPVVEGACTRVETTTGVRRVSFRGTRVIVTGSTIPSFTVRLRGERRRSGSRTTDVSCVEGNDVEHADCVATRTKLRGASISVRPTRVRLSVGRLQLPAETSTCPVPSGRVPPASGAANLPKGAPAGYVRFFVRGGIDRREQDADGGVRWRIRWKVTFERVS